jgi:hypothetical protein
MVRKLVLADTSLYVWGPDWSSSTSTSGATTNNNKNNKANTQLLAPGHLGVMWSLLFSFLDCTVDYCGSHQAITETTTPTFDHPPAPAPVPVPFVKPEVVELVTNVIPPPLNVDLTLNNVSCKWRQEQIHQRERCEKPQKQQQQNDNPTLTTTTVCPTCFCPGAGAKSQNTFLSLMARQQQQSPGWSFVGDRLLLRSDANDSKLTLQSPLMNDQPHVPRVFVTTHPDNVIPASLLHVTVSSVAVTGNKKEGPRDPVAVGSMTISNVHGSDSIVALPCQMSLPQGSSWTTPNSNSNSNSNRHVQVELRLEGTSSMEIVAMFLCHHL